MPRKCEDWYSWALPISGGLGQPPVISKPAIWRQEIPGASRLTKLIVFVNSGFSGGSLRKLPMLTMNLPLHVCLYTCKHTQTQRHGKILVYYDLVMLSSELQESDLFYLSFLCHCRTRAGFLLVPSNIFLISFSDPLRTTFDFCSCVATSTLITNI